MARRKSSGAGKSGPSKTARLESPAKEPESPLAAVAPAAQPVVTASGNSSTSAGAAREPAAVAGTENGAGGKLTRADLAVRGPELQAAETEQIKTAFTAGMQSVAAASKMEPLRAAVKTTFSDEGVPNPRLVLDQDESMVPLPVTDAVGASVYKSAGGRGVPEELLTLSVSSTGLTHPAWLKWVKKTATDITPSLGLPPSPHQTSSMLGIIPELLSVFLQPPNSSPFDLISAGGHDGTSYAYLVIALPSTCTSGGVRLNSHEVEVVDFGPGHDGAGPLDPLDATFATSVLAVRTGMNQAGVIAPEAGWRVVVVYLLAYADRAVVVPALDPQRSLREKGEAKLEEAFDLLKTPQDECYSMERLCYRLSGYKPPREGATIANLPEDNAERKPNMECRERERWECVNDYMEDEDEEREYDDECDCDRHTFGKRRLYPVAQKRVVVSVDSESEGIEVSSDYRKSLVDDTTVLTEMIPSYKIGNVDPDEEEIEGDSYEEWEMTHRYRVVMVMVWSNRHRKNQELEALSNAQIAQRLEKSLMRSVWDDYFAEEDLTYVDLSFAFRQSKGYDSAWVSKLLDAASTAKRERAGKLAFERVLDFVNQRTDSEVVGLARRPSTLSSLTSKFGFAAMKPLLDKVLAGLAADAPLTPDLPTPDNLFELLCGIVDFAEPEWFTSAQSQLHLGNAALESALAGLASAVAQRGELPLLSCECEVCVAANVSLRGPTLEIHLEDKQGPRDHPHKNILALKRSDLTMTTYRLNPPPFLLVIRKKPFPAVGRARTALNAAIKSAKAGVPERRALQQVTNQSRAG